MKKIIVPVVAFLLFAGVSNAQMTQKTPVKTKAKTTSTKTMVTKPANTTTSVTPKTTTTSTTKTTTVVKRKHHKAHKAVPKKAN
jgi:hypothetical protein